MRSTGIALATAVGLALVTASSAAAAGVATMDEAKEMAAKTGKPILVDFFTEW